ncbi:chorismate mutase [bacterium]|nr:chorismate mutase [bacterium]
MHPNLKLENIRNVLIRQEETIIFALVERAQFKQNKIIYLADGIPIPNFEESFVDYLLRGTEVLHATVRRYTSPEEHPFFKGLPDSILPAEAYDYPIKKTNININNHIKDIYINKILPTMCVVGDDGQYGSSAICDVAALQALSKRIHYGKFVAESKFLSDKEAYVSLIKAKDKVAIREKITNKNVEEKLFKRVALKAAAYGKEIDTTTSDQENQKQKISPQLVADIYEKWLIPLTKDVEVDYLLVRGC